MKEDIAMKNLENEKRIKVEDYTGFWSIIDTYKNYALLEHNTYGDETCYLVINMDKVKDRKDIKLKNGNVVNVPFVTNESFIIETYDDIITALIDERIIE